VTSFGAATALYRHLRCARIDRVQLRYGMTLRALEVSVRFVSKCSRRIPPGPGAQRRYSRQLHIRSCGWIRICLSCRQSAQLVTHITVRR